MINDNSTRAELRKEEGRENRVENLMNELWLHPVIMAFEAYERAVDEWHDDVHPTRGKLSDEDAFIEAFQNHIDVQILNGTRDIETVLRDAAQEIVEASE